MINKRFRRNSYHDLRGAYAGQIVFVVFIVFCLILNS